MLFGGQRIIAGQGGVRQGEFLGDTWSWNGETKTWAKHEPVFRPHPRAYHYMAYRPASGVVLQGGFMGRYLDGTFTWDGLTWTVKREGPQTVGSTMAYHPNTDLVVLETNHGVGLGIGASADGVWAGTAWAETVSPIPMRYFPAMAPDALGNLVYFGGNGRVSPVKNASNDTPGPPPPPAVEQCPNDVSREVSEGPRIDTVLPESMLPTGQCLGIFGNYIQPTAADIVNGPQGAQDVERGDTWVLATPTRVDGPDTGERVTIKVDPFEIPIDDGSGPPATAKVTVTATWAGNPEPGYEITLSTDGDVTFADYRGVTKENGEYTTLITASKTPGPETITATYERSLKYRAFENKLVNGGVAFLPLGVNNTVNGVLINPKPVSTVLSERGMTLTLDPVAIPADGKATSRATAKVHKAGLVDEKVCFKTNGDVSFGAPGDDDCVTEVSGPGAWDIIITASNTPAVETITATGVASGLSVTADLFEGMGGWMNRTAEGPNPTPGRENAAMAYDEANNVTVLFGGYHGNHHRTSRLAAELTLGDRRGCFEISMCPPDPAKVVGDTWIWDGSKWSELTFAEGQAPTPREGAAMAYDASSGGLVLFGGHDGNDYLADTWTFDAKTKTWTRHNVAGPAKRYVANMASDGTGVVLFAGTAGWAYDNDGPTGPDGPGRLHDTWIWRNGAWTEVSPKPPPPPPPPANQRTFENSDPIVVPLPPPPPGCPFPDQHCPSDKANPYPATIDVAGQTGTVAKVTVTLNKLSWPKSSRPDDPTGNLPPDANGPADAEIMVVAPGGKKSVMVMSDSCGSDDPEAVGYNPQPIPRDSPVTLRFDDDAAAELPADGPCTDKDGTTHRPTNPQCCGSPKFRIVDHRNPAVLERGIGAWR